MPSPNVKIAGSEVIGNKATVSDTTYTITLNNTSGVSSWVLSVASTSDNVIAADYTLTKTNEFTYTFLTPDKTTNGSTVRFKSQINNGLNAGVYDPSLTTTFILYEKVEGLRLLAPGETTEIDPVFGWTKTINELIMAVQGLL
jgi:hypothetical protein